MILKRLKISTWIGDETNCYIVFDQESKETMVVDPAGDVDKIIEMINILQGKLKYIFLTHCHGDHISGAKELKNKMKGEILIHRDDYDGLNNKKINLTELLDGFPEIEINADCRLDDGDLIHVGDIEFKVIATPGHTKGGVSLYCEKERLVFTGDTMFSGTWGRTDLPTSNFEELMDSITNKLMKLPGETICYPGHGKTTMIEDEKSIYLELKEKEF